MPSNKLRIEVLGRGRESYSRAVAHCFGRADELRPVVGLHARRRVRCTQRRLDHSCQNRTPGGARCVNSATNSKRLVRLEPLFAPCPFCRNLSEPQNRRRHGGTHRRHPPGGLSSGRSSSARLTVIGGHDTMSNSLQLGARTRWVALPPGIAPHLLRPIRMPAGRKSAVSDRAVQASGRSGRLARDVQHAAGTAARESVPHGSRHTPAA